MAGAAGNGIVIEAVTEENYEYWSVLVENYLRGKGIWYLVDPNQPALRVSDDDHSHSTTGDDDDSNNNRQNKDKDKDDMVMGLRVLQLQLASFGSKQHLYLSNVKHDEAEAMKDAEALHVIQLACGSEHLPKIIHCKTAKEAWNNLKALFKQESKADQQTRSGIIHFYFYGMD